MLRRGIIIGAVLVAAAILFAQQTTQQAGAEKKPTVADAIVQKGEGSVTDDDVIQYVCPMHKDYRQNTPGKCPRCGMTLIPDLTESREYPLLLSLNPKVAKANENTQLHFRIEDPDTHKPVTEYTEMHEKLYHLFVVSQDTEFFNHVHPVKQPDGSFILDEKFPHPGMYRILSDFYPTGGTPQLIASTVMVAGAGFKMETPHLQADTSPKDSTNLHVELVLDPPQPIAGFKTIMFFKLTPNKNIEQYIGAWGHMLTGSWDLIDMVHSHPLYITDPEEGAYKQIQFNEIFARAGIYKVWVQFQRAGKVNTVVFNVPVKNLE